MSSDANVIVLGAGLAGLSAAYRLKGNARVIERTSLPGGLCQTSEDNGFRFDKTGHLLHFKDPKIKNAVFSLLENEPAEINRKSRVFSKGIFTPYPFQANTRGLPKKIIAECLIGYIRAVSKETSAPESATFEDFILRHFGDGIAKHFMIPYNTKLWGVHPKEITAAWCKRFVPIPTVEEVINGAIGTTVKNMGYNSTFWYPKSGICELPLALARRVHNIDYESSPTIIDPKKRGLLIGSNWIPYGALVSTIPLNDLMGLLTEVPKWALLAASKLRCSSLRYLDLALTCKVGDPFHWTYVPEKKYPFYRVGCYSNFSRQMAPRGRDNLYVELTSKRRQKLSKYLPKVVTGLIDMGLIQSPRDIAFARERLLRHAYVIYDEHREKAVPKLLRWLQTRGIFCAGRYGVWEYGSMEDSIRQGFESAEGAREFLK